MKNYPVIHIGETASTNQYLTALCDGQPGTVAEFTTVSADFQTAGKGQRGNSWESEAGKNLLFSVVLFPEFMEVKQQFLLSQLISLAIKEELDCHTEEISIKWPNDIYWKEKKICGILIENDLKGRRIGRCIAGIGININQETFRSDAPNPVSLKQATGKEHDRDAVLQHILDRIAAYYSQLKRHCQSAAPEAFTRFSAEIAERYARALFRREGMHPYRDANGEFLARLVRVEPDGRFVLRDEEGHERGYLFKEVRFLMRNEEL